MKSKKDKRDSAVSEVVGVLLMLSVTVLIAGAAALAASNSVGEQNAPISANIAAADAGSDGIILELISGDSFSLDSISIRLGIREDSSKYIVLTRDMNVEFLKSYSGSRIITIGDRFKIIGKENADKSGVSFGDFSVNYGNHISYVIYDSNGAPISSGDILVK